MCDGVSFSSCNLVYFNYATVVDRLKSARRWRLSVARCELASLRTQWSGPRFVTLTDVANLCATCSGQWASCRGPTGQAIQKQASSEVGEADEWVETTGFSV